MNDRLKSLFGSDYLIELLTPKQNSESLDSDLEKFSLRYRMLLEKGFVISVPDNPMGHPHFQLTEVISELGLPVNSNQLLLHINTFHNRQGLDAELNAAQRLGIQKILVVSGDGSERLTKLSAADLGISRNTVTSVELLEYIGREYKGVFRCGVAFNPYEPVVHELEKLKRKTDAGAMFVATQPVVLPSDKADVLDQIELPVFVGVWMSKRLELLSECVGYSLEAGEVYDPFRNMEWVQSRFPGRGLYLTMLPFKLLSVLQSRLSV